jgi:protein-disulfide isomerase
MSSRVEEKQRLRAEREAKEAAAGTAATRNRRMGILGGVIGAAVVVVIVLVLISSGGGGSGPKGLGKGEGVKGASAVTRELKGIPQKGTVIGSPKAPVTITEFADLQCPFCAQFSSNALPGVIQKYVRTGKVKIELRLLRFLGNDSDPAARGAAAASQQNKMWQFAALFYRNQGEENTGYVTTAFLKRIARGVPGLDVAKFTKAMGGTPAHDQVALSERRAEVLGVNSTPTVYAGKTGAQPKQIDTSQFSAEQVSSEIQPLLAGAG